MASTFVIIVMFAQHGQLLVAPPFPEDAAVRLATMNDSVSPYRIHRTSGESPPFRLQPSRSSGLITLGESKTTRSFSGPMPRPASGGDDSKPWLRYGKAGSGVDDGALFAFSTGTDPEVVLMIESLPPTRPASSDGSTPWPLCPRSRSRSRGSGMRCGHSPGGKRIPSTRPSRLLYVLLAGAALKKEWDQNNFPICLQDLAFGRGC